MCVCVSVGAYAGYHSCFGEWTVSQTDRPSTRRRRSTHDFHKTSLPEVFGEASPNRAARGDLRGTGGVLIHFPVDD